MDVVTGALRSTCETGLRLKSEAALPEHKQMIDRNIGAADGGFEEFGRELLDHLQGWLLECALRALEGAQGDAARLAFVFETITSHLPDDDEQALLRGSLQQLRADYEQRPDHAEAACRGVALPRGVTAPELAAWSLLTSAVYNLDVTRTRQ